MSRWSLFKEWLVSIDKKAGRFFERKCSACKGSGMNPATAWGVERCPTCEGYGTRKMQNMIEGAQT
jgi:DnaJ-class molecular chaperone